MLFNSVQFLVFFPIVILVLFLVPRKVRKYWLLVVSYYFYMCWNVKYSALLAFSTIATFLTGILLGKATTTRLKKLCVAVCFVINLGILFVFKYANFTILNVNSLFGSNFATGDILLPVGISFYTFQALGYIIDVYRGDIEPQKNIVDYALFISFFPQLVAGPIERAGNILIQIKKIEERKLFETERIMKGLLLMGWGLFQKIVISDRIAIIVDNVYDKCEEYEYGFIPLAVATVLFAFQIYCDFDGYTNIARGASRVMGMELMKNFKQPYFATNIVEFWKRWHISLTGWFRDYLYIPLGGNQKGEVRKYINILIVFLVSGLWHGAEWSFVLWGGIHGISQIVSHLIRRKKKNSGSEKLIFSARLIRIIGTFIITDIAWFFFRANSIGRAVDILKQTLSRTGDFSMITGILDTSNWRILFVGLIVLFIVDVLHEKNYEISDLIFKQQIWFRYIVYVLLVVACIYLGVNAADDIAHQFIYFQF